MSARCFSVPYTLEDKERLFDLGQGIHSNVALLVKKGGGTVLPFSRALEKMKVQALLFGALAVLQGGLMGLSGVSAGKIVLAVFCALFGGFLWTARRGNQKAFDRAKVLYLQNNGHGGTLTIDEDGIRERSERGVETCFTWEDYRCCVMSREVIVVAFHKPVMLIFSRTRETEAGLLEALTAFEKEKTIYEAEIKEKRK